MKIVIDVSEKAYNRFCQGYRFPDEVEEAIVAITDGTPLPEGHWKRVRDKTGNLVWECTCGWQQRFYTNFCPDCGAKMIKENKS